ncbi:MAG TPA: methyltransferase domain-containing protein [Mycobacteriales bacterium]|nr:methyltransferase domain-containing protein [Mycobacteriales bacterium]
MQPFFDAILDALEPLDGLRHLDAGCGAGMLLARSARRGAVVSGVDASAALLDIARERTPAAHLQVGDIEALPVGDDAYDLVTAVNAIQYAVDPAAAVAELARACRPGGRVAIGIWGDAARCETEALFARLRSLAPPPPGTPAPLACSDDGVVEELLTKAGLVVTAGGERTVSMVFTDHDDAFTKHSASGPLQKVIDIAGEHAVRRVLRDVLEVDRKPDGALRQDNVFRYVLADNPA